MKFNFLLCARNIAALCKRPSHLEAQHRRAVSRACGKMELVCWCYHSKLSLQSERMRKHSGVFFRIDSGPAGVERRGVA